MPQDRSRDARVGVGGWRLARHPRGVIPAQAGIQFFLNRRTSGPELDSRLRGNDAADLEGLRAAATGNLPLSQQGLAFRRGCGQIAYHENR
jgi:hypothetical protein